MNFLQVPMCLWVKPVNVWNDLKICKTGVMRNLIVSNGPSTVWGHYHDYCTNILVPLNVVILHIDSWNNFNWNAFFICVVIIKVSKAK